jgi:adenine deaminase
MKIDNPEIVTKNIENLLEKGFTCGTVAAYTVSEFFNFPFDENDFLCSKSKMETSFLIDYFQKKGLFLSHRANNENKTNVKFVFENLSENGILLIAVYEQYKGNKIGHCGVVLNFNDSEFDLMFGNNPYQMSEVQGFYSIFISNNDILKENVFWT